MPNLSKKSTAQQKIAETEALLKTIEIANPRFEAHVLIAHSLQIDRFTLLRDRERVISEEEELRLNKIVSRRLQYEPIPYILKKQEFWNLPFQVTPDVLIPRPWSEEIVINVLNAIENGLKADRILELGVGSGCLLLSILSELPDSQGVGVDLSSKALKIAAINAQNLGMSKRTQFIKSNWGQEVTGLFDIIVANPPYLTTSDYDFLKKPMREYEPRSAYISGKDGLCDYKVLAPEIKRLLAPKGQVFLEADASRKYLITDVFKKHNFTLTHEFDNTIHAFLTLRYSDVSATADKRHNNPTDVSATADKRHNSPTNK